MQSHNDVNNPYTVDAHKLTAAKKTYRPYFYEGSQHYANINLDPEIIHRLGITPDTELIQEITPEGILLRRFKETI